MNPGGHLHCLWIRGAAGTHAREGERSPCFTLQHMVSDPADDTLHGVQS